MTGDIDNAFCAVRPPGHHAEVDRAMGFCYFNNVAIGAKYLKKRWGVQRIGIIDFDVHHGNGTQHIFEQDPTVFYYSIHEHPSFAYPGTGREFETGIGEGLGYTLNSPILPGRGDDEYKKMIMQDLVPAFKKFQPEVILLSAGFDAHVDRSDVRDQPVDRGIRFYYRGHSQPGEQICRRSGNLCSRGGYNYPVLALLVENHIRMMTGVR